MDGDADQPKPPPERKEGRNKDWKHLFNRDVVSMPDKWEYPWVSKTTSLPLFTSFLCVIFSTSYSMLHGILHST